MKMQKNVKIDPKCRKTQLQNFKKFVEKNTTKTAQNIEKVMKISKKNRKNRRRWTENGQYRRK
jgi:hypothetical protein